MYENKISARQLRRMIFIETFGAGALSVPAFACYKEQNGFWSLIFYGVFLAGTIAFFIIFSGKISEENFENRKIGKKGLETEKNLQNKRIDKKNLENARACLKNHSSNLHTPICGIFCLHSVTVAHYAALIQAKSPANCDAHLAESIFQTRSRKLEQGKNLKSRETSKENLEEKNLTGLINQSRDANISVSKMKTRLKSINFPEVLPQPIKFVYMIRFFINAVALFYFFGKTIQTVYMPESSFLFIIFPAAILLWYSLYTTLQKRARFLEIIFPWIITTYFIAVILSFIGIEKAMQIGKAGELWQGILSDNIFRSMGNGYLMLLCSSPIEFLLFLRPAAEERGIETKNRKVEDKDNKEDKNNKEGKDDKAIRGIITAVAGAILCNALFCFLSVRTLGPNLTSQSEWPVIKMMQLIRMPGGFLERFDILPIIFWILCMMAVLSGYLYYGWSIFQTRSGGCLKNFLGITFVCLVLLTCVVEKNTFLWTFYLKYKAFVDFPLSLILPLVVWLFKRQKDFNYQEKTKEKIEKDKEERKNIAKYKEDKKTEEGSVAKYKEDKKTEESNDTKYKEDKKTEESSAAKYEEDKKTEESNIAKYKEDKKTEENSVAKYKNNKQAKYFAGITLLIFLPILFFLTGCQRLTDVEEKNYILSMYVDYLTGEENAYQFWIARANLSEMEGKSDEIPCQITKIEARNLQELEEKYLETVPGKTEWNHIYTIFLGSGIAANKTACTHLLKEWDNEWQKSPNVLLALCPENPKKLYKIKNIPAGAAGQEINLLAEQNKEKYSGQICETPIDYLRAKQQKEDKITLYRVTIENDYLRIMTDEL